MGDAYKDWCENREEIQAMVAADKKKAAQPCSWTYDLDSDSYDTTCGHKFQIMNDAPLENHMKFCAFCGKKLREVLT